MKRNRFNSHAFGRPHMISITAADTRINICRVRSVNDRFEITAHNAHGCGVINDQNTRRPYWNPSSEARR